VAAARAFSYRERKNPGLTDAEARPSHLSGHGMAVMEWVVKLEAKSTIFLIPHQSDQNCFAPDRMSARV
jgi:hypothetical protein